jgi:hypothetical protein
MKASAITCGSREFVLENECLRTRTVEIRSEGYRGRIRLVVRIVVDGTRSSRGVRSGSASRICRKRPVWGLFPHVCCPAGEVPMEATMVPFESGVKMRKR